MNENALNPYLWYGQRELDFLPKHFVMANTKATVESKIWIIKNLIGRYCIILGDDFFMLENNQIGTVYFEDPAECMAFELRWS